MYSNIGKKIMTLAVAVAVIMMLATFGYGIGLITESQEALGALIMIFGPIGSWVVGAFLYGFGRLIDNSDYIARKMGRRDGFGIPDTSDRLDWASANDDDGDADDDPPAKQSFIAHRVVSEKKDGDGEK